MMLYGVAKGSRVTRPRDHAWRGQEPVCGAFLRDGKPGRVMRPAPRAGRFCRHCERVLSKVEACKTPAPDSSA